MNRVQRTALLAFFLLILMALAGWLFGGKKSQPADAEPDVIGLDVSQSETVMLLPPESRKQYLKPSRFQAPPVDDPWAPNGNRRAGSYVDDSSVGQASEGSFDRQADPQAAALAASLRSVRMRQDETLSQIALRELGDKNRWREILVLNNLENARTIKVGQLLYLPDPGTKVAMPNEAQSADSMPNAAVANRFHTVKRGDVLGTISQHYYGTSRETNRILVANGLENADQIRAGQVLIIPPRD